MKSQSRTRRSMAAGCLTSVALLSTLASGCSSGGSSSATTTTSSAPVPSPSSSAPVAPTSATSDLILNLSGKWTGHYGGTYTGTFHLSWQQTGSKLSGTITLSAPASTLSVNGTVTGGTINFGTVGSSAITYTGDVSATSMAGTYQVGGANAGTWTATTP